MDIRVVIGRFDDLVSYGLRALIDGEPNLTVVAFGVEPDRLDGVIAEHQPDVVILGLSTLASPVRVRELHVAHPDTRILVLANRPSSVECNQVLAFGATAVLGKDTQARDVLNAIHLASRGLHVLPRDFSGGADLLTPREADVLEHLQAGRSNAEIAAALTVGVETVRSHARAIYRKLGVRTRRELVRR